MGLTLKDLRKNKVAKVASTLLEKELNRLYARVELYTNKIEELKPLLEASAKEEQDRNAKGVPHPYTWHESPTFGFKSIINNAEVTINKAYKKIKIIEAELTDRILTGGINV